MQRYESLSRRQITQQYLRKGKEGGVEGSRMVKEVV